MGMEVSSADSSQGWVMKGGIQGNIDMVQPNHGFQSEESMESCMVETPQATRNIPYEDCMLKLEEAEKDLRSKLKKIDPVYKKLKRKRWDLCRLNQQSCALTWKEQQHDQVLQTMMRVLKPPFHAELAKMHHPGNIKREMAEDLCSSEKELNSVMKRLGHCLQHRRDTSVKERQLLREMELLEGTREEVVAKFLKENSQYYPFGAEKAIQDQFAGVDLAGAKKGHQAIKKKMELLEDESKLKYKEICLLEKEYQTLNDKRIETSRTVSKLRKECEALATSSFIKA